MSDLTPEEWFTAMYWQTEPVPAIVTRSTDKCVWIGGARHDKTTEYRCYRPTKDEVWEWLIGRAIGERDHAQRSADSKQEFLDKLYAARRKGNG